MGCSACLIKTYRLVLKTLAEEDKDSFFRMAKDERIKETYMMPELADPDEEFAFFNRIKALCFDENHFVYGIYLNGELIGFINDCGIEGTGIELGYFIVPERQNMGFATEALSAAISELFSMGFDCIRAGYFEENAASRRVMEKCGMTPVDTESFITYRGRDHKCLFCEIRNN